MKHFYLHTSRFVIFSAYMQKRPASPVYLLVFPVLIIWFLTFSQAELYAQVNSTNHLNFITSTQHAAGVEKTAAIQLLPAANQPPVANAGEDIEVTDEAGNGAVDVSLDGTASFDEDGSIVSYVWRWGEEDSTTEAAPTVNLPVGITLITLTVTDNEGATASDEVNVTVLAAPGQAPVAEEQSVEVPANTPTEIQLEGSGPDGLVFAIVENPEHGAIESFDDTQGTLLYVPEENYAGNDKFSFQVSDGVLSSEPAEVSLTIAAAPPVVKDSTATVNQGESVEITLGPAGTDDAPIEYEIEDDPENGELGAIVNNTVIYTPNPGFAGEDSFTFTASNEEEESDEATITITVLAVNQPPVITGQAEDLSTNVNQQLEIPLSALAVEDEDNTYPDDFTLIILPGVSYTFNGNTLTPAADFTGTLIVNVQVNDGNTNSDTFPLNVTVIATNTPPTVSDIPDQTLQQGGEAVVLDLTNYFADEEEDAANLAYSVENNTNPDVVGSDIDGSSLTLTPAGNNAGGAEITLQATDQAGEFVQTTFTVTVTAVNSPPVLSNLEVTFIVFDINSAPQNFTQSLDISDPDDTELEGATIRFIREGETNFYPAEDVLQYTTSGNISGQWVPGTGTLTFSGTASIAAYRQTIRSVQYNNSRAGNPTPGVRQLSVTVTDGTDESAPLTRPIAVVITNRPPIVSSFTVDLEENQAYTFAANDFISHYQDDNDNTFTGIYIQSVPEHGSLTFNGQAITNTLIENAPEVNGQFAGFFVEADDIDQLSYTPEEDYVGQDTFAWNASDGSSFAANAANVTFTIEGINNPPVIEAPNSVRVSLAAPYTFTNIRISDPDAGQSPIRVRMSVSRGTLAFSNQQAAAGLDFTEGDASGSAVLTFEASQNAIATALQSLTYTSDESNGTTDFLLIQVSDLGATGTGGARETNAQIEIIISNINDIPVLSNLETHPLLYPEKSGPLALTQSITINDAEEDAISAATITISTATFVTTEDVLGFDDTDKIQGRFTNNRLTLTGTASVEEYEQALRSVTYENTSENPNQQSRQVSFQVTDARNGISSTLSREIQIVRVEEVFILTDIETAPLPYLLGSNPVLLSETISIQNPDNKRISGVQIRFADNTYQAGEDSLFTEAGIADNSNWNAAEGILSLEGDHSTEEYIEILRSVQYINTLGYEGTAGDRRLSIQLLGEDTVSNTLSRTLQVIANQPPVLSSFDKVVIPGRTLTFTPADFEAHFTDPDNNPNGGRLYHIRITSLPAQGQLLYQGEAISQEGLTIEAGEIGDLSYAPAPAYTGSDIFRWTASDGADEAEEDAAVNIMVTDFAISAGEDADICQGEEVALGVSATGGSGNYSYAWRCDQSDCALDNTQTADIFAEPQVTTTYIVEVTDTELAVTLTDTVVVRSISCENIALDIPSGFTPNGDGVNDTWDIENIHDATAIQVEVFDRYGKRVFYSENYTKAWDGTQQGKAMPVGTYYYMIRVTYQEERQYKGSVTILK